MLAEQTFKDVMAQFASGVTVVTVPDAAGAATGMTVTAFASLSLQPPSILVCISQRAECHDSLLASDYFGVNILKQDQQDLVFAFAATGEDKQKALRKLGLQWRQGQHGVPWFECLARLECRRTEVHRGSDHSIIIGAVVAGEVLDPSAKPMVYARRGFWS